MEAITLVLMPHARFLGRENDSGVVHYMMQDSWSGPIGAPHAVYCGMRAPGPLTLLERDNGDMVTCLHCQGTWG